MQKIILAGINVFRNRGTEALALSNVQELARAFPGAQIVLTTRDVAGATASFPNGEVVVVPDNAWSPPVDAPASAKAIARLKRWIRRDLLGRMQPQEAAFKGADLVVVSGGDTFSSDYDVMERYLRQLDQPAAAGVPILFLAHSIGPFKTEAEKASFSAMAKNCVFTVRETISQAYLTETLGVDPATVTLTADPAFLMEVPDETRARMLAAYGLEPGTYATCATSRSISGWTGIGHEGHVAAWAAAARALMDEIGKVVLVPHVQMPEGHQDDLALAREIHAALGHDPRCVVMDQALHNAIEFKAVVGRALFNVAERTHCAIGGMSSGVPTLSIGYSIKAEGVLRLLVKNEDLVKISLIAAPDFSAETAGATVMTAYHARDRFAAELGANLPAVKDLAALNYRIARDLAKGRA